MCGDFTTSRKPSNLLAVLSLPCGWTIAVAHNSPNLGLFNLFSIGAAAAQDVAPTPLPPNPAPTGGSLTQFFTKTPYEFWLTCLICALGLAVIGALIPTLRRIENTRPEDIARPVIVITVIVGTLILITAGYNNEQIAPAFGLFGTIIGYMLGRFATQASGVSPADTDKTTVPAQPQGEPAAKRGEE